MLWKIGIVALVAVAAYLATLWRRFFKPPGSNPFVITSAPKKALETDQKIRDKILKNVFAQEKIPSQLDAVVVGSGIGGLSSAAVLAKAGQRVLVLEQHDQAGGCCHTYVEKGYEFDVGIHYIGGMSKGQPDRALTDLITDGQLDWSPLDKAFDVVQFGFDKDSARRYNIVSGRDAWKTELLAKFPSEDVAIEKFFQLIRRCDRAQMGAMVLKVLPLWLSRILIFTGLVNKLTDYFKLNQVSTMDAVRELTDNKELQAVLMYSFGDYGTSPDKSGFPMQATLHAHFAKGAWYPIGGASEIAFNTIPVIQQAGGQVLVRAHVSQIVVDPVSGAAVGVKVQKSGSSGSQEFLIKAPVVISGAGIFNTFQRLLPQPVAEQSYFYDITRRLSPSPALLSVFVGLDVDDADLDVKAQNVWAFNDPNFVQLMNAYRKLPAEEVADSEIPLLFVSFPSKKDPTWRARYPGKSTLAIITVTNFDWFKDWEESTHRKRGVDYDAFKNAIGYRMLAQVERMYPQIKGKVDYLEVGSPLSNNFYLNSTRGEVYGLDHTMERFGPQMTAALRPETDIRGLFLTGQDTLSCGFMGALWAGVISASIVLGRRFTFFDEIEAMAKSAKLEPKQQ